MFEEFRNNTNMLFMEFNYGTMNDRIKRVLQDTSFKNIIRPYNTKFLKELSISLIKLYYT